MEDPECETSGAFGLGGGAERRYRLRLARYPAAARVIEAHTAGRPGRVLDAGVGRGRVARVCRAGQLRWVGLDLAPERLAEAARSDLYRLVRGDLRALPFPPGRFDVVCCIQVLEHFEEDEARRIAAALGALLRPGGLLLLSVPVFPRIALSAVAALDRARDWAGLPPLRNGGDHLSHFDLRGALGLLPAGYVPRDVRGVRLVSLPGKALEDRRWWYRAQGWAAERFPGLAIEVNVAAVKPGGAALPSQ